MNIKIYAENISLEKGYNDSVLLSTVFSDMGINFDMPCGGKHTCGKCKVKIQGNISEITGKEKRILTEAELKAGIRLACLTYVYGDASVYLQNKNEIKSINSNETDIPKIKTIGESFGAAIDIGTTTVAVAVFDLESGNRLYELCEKNPQISYGADVITRIQKSIDGFGKAMSDLIIGKINDMLLKICGSVSINMSDIDSAVITGNTAMLYLLCNQNVNSIARLPFKQDRSFGEWLSAQELGLNIAEDAKIYLPPVYAAYIGADMLTSILFSNMEKSERPVLLADIGTNGEIALFSKGRFSCCSTAAGPAFEGAEIQCGMNAVSGAISKVFVEENKIIYKTIDETDPIGICGSGLLDAVSVFLSEGIIDETGVLLSEGHKYIENISQINGETVFVFHNQSVFISAKDIRAVQLAKSAICAGINTLINESDINSSDIETLYIAGGFGNFMNAVNAEHIGLIPKGFAEKVKYIGNAALNGAAMILMNCDYIDELVNKTKNAKTIELSNSAYFMDNYIDCMMF